MNVVIDTSVAVKWFLPEQDHETAVALLATQARFHAPDLIFTEFATAMHKKIGRGEADASLSAESCAALPGLFSAITPTLLLFERALNMALAMAHPVQDCIFLACAEQDGLTLVTADRKLIDKSNDRGFGQLVVGLADALRACGRDERTVSIRDEQVQDIRRLTVRIEATFEGLREAHLNSSGRFRIVPHDVVAPAFTTPAYVRLKSLVTSLPHDQLRDLIALCWLGRGYDGTDWSRIRELASAFLGAAPEDPIRYALSLVTHLDAGLDLIGAGRPSFDTHRDA